jgi:hypothetical protein
MTDRTYSKLSLMAQPQAIMGGEQHKLSEQWRWLPPAQDNSVKTVNFSDPSKLPEEFQATGHSRHDLLCGSEMCDEVLMRGWAPDEMRARFKSEVPVVALCGCGAYSVLPVSLG